ncbi:MAG: hypothetical protein JO199_05775, partial [Candidatus Eremiobacteraeota bacterium]|nr:hypothetical protein [Candidatus Eremiobacteraeota bacterium]
VLYSFKGGLDGAYPEAGLTYVDGTLYGTTRNGGGSDRGTVYAISTSGTEHVIYSFPPGNGTYPNAALTNVNGTLYGTTPSGGTSNRGAVFAVSTAGEESLIYSFRASGDGEEPVADLTSVGDTLYGTTEYGGKACPGTAGCGTIFSLVKPTCLNTQCVYVYSGTGSSVGQITGYATNATSGNVPPLFQLAGSYTLFRILGRSGIAVGPDHKVYALVCGINPSCTPQIEVFAAGATGNVSPIATIRGSHTGLIDGEGGVAVDNQGNIFATSGTYYPGQASITVYPAGSNGDVTPSQTITGSYTDLYNPSGIAVDSSHNIYIDGEYGHRITVYGAGANGNVAPIQEIKGNATQQGYDSGMALDSAGNMYVANPSNAILVFAAGATGNVAPIRVIKGSYTDYTQLSYPYGVAVDASNNVYASNNVQGDAYITMYASGANGNVKPIGIINGAATGLNGYAGFGVAVR